jgi:SAM-dependent methyltransferase
MSSPPPPLSRAAGEGRRTSSRADWRKWGEIDPLFGVASWPGKRVGDSIPWTDDEFYGLGLQDWEDFAALWERFGLRRGRCAEIGCGAGRITRHLAETFEAVEAIDVSEGMIRYARERIVNPAVRFHVTDGLGLPLPDASVDAVFSTHVFQHLDSYPQAASYFAEMARVMRTGATLMIHVPVHDWPVLPRTMERLYKLRRLAGDVRAFLAHRLVEQNRVAPAIRGLSFPVDFVFGTLRELGLAPIEITVMAVRSNGALHPFVLARKP